MPPLRLLAVLVLSACGHRGPGGPAPTDCPAPAPDDQPAAFGTVLIDGRRVTGYLPVRRTQEAPESYDFVEEPAQLRALPAHRIDLIQFLRSAEADPGLGLCPGTVALLVTLRPG